MVTIIIPTYKPGDYLLDCLKSLDRQSIGKDSFRVLIVLNGDREPFYSRISNWLSELALQAEIIYSEDKGVSNARNLGLSKSTGEFVAFIDDDDYVSPSYLESLLACADSAPEGTIVCSDVRTFDNEGNIGKDYISRAYNRAMDNPSETNIFLRRSFLSSSCCKLIPRSVIGDRRFQPGLKIGEDSLFMATISDRIKRIVPTAPDAIYFRRLRPGSASRSKESGCKRNKRKSKLIAKYIGVYSHNIPNYNFLFFLSRIVAIIKS